MKTSINLFPVAAVSWIMVIYLIAANNHSWYIWVFVGMAALERLLVQLLIWIQSMAFKVMAQEMLKRSGQIPQDPGL